MSLTDILRRLRGTEPDEPRRASRAPAPARSAAYHAVAVVAGTDACKPAQALRGKRMLSQESPPIPLPDCTKPESCQCRFAKFNDRRQEDDRRDILSFSRFYPGMERRRTGGRRATDH
ncbi:MAG: hypothetical protein ABI885_30010 [Gammaproteobacteria bacterium]